MVGAKLIRGFRTKTAVVLGCLAFLALGYWVRPRQRQAALAKESAVPIIAEEVRRREPALVFETVFETTFAAGRDARVSVAVLTTDPWAPPAAPVVVSDRDAHSGAPLPEVGLGIIHTDGRHVLSHRAALPPGPGVAALLAEGRRVPLKVEAYEIDTGLVWLAGEGLNEPAAQRAPKAGELAVAVTSMDNGGAFVPVLFGSDCGIDCRLAMELKTLPPGSPIFGLSGRALAIAGSESEGVAYGVEAAVRRLQAKAGGGHAFPASLGLSLQAMTPGLVGRLGAGVLVSDVTAGGPAAQAGIEPGDVLVACAEETLGDLEPALARIQGLTPGRGVRLTLRRGSGERHVEVVPEAISPIRSARALENRSDRSSGAAVEAVLPEAVLEQLAPLDDHMRVVAIEGTRVRSTAQARGLLRRHAEPWLLRLADGRRSYFVLAGEAAQ
jgi:hypothetical protein